MKIRKVAGALRAEISGIRLDRITAFLEHEVIFAESDAVLRFLFQHQVRPEFTCSFSWQTRSAAFRDNRCVLHNPVNDYQGHGRLMHRTTLRGVTPR